MDEDDELSDNMEVSIDEVLVDDDYALTRSDQNAKVKSTLAPYLDDLPGIKFLFNSVVYILLVFILTSSAPRSMGMIKPQFTSYC